MDIFNLAICLFLIWNKKREGSLVYRASSRKGAKATQRKPPLEIPLPPKKEGAFLWILKSAVFLRHQERATLPFHFEVNANYIEKWYFSND